mmetsp:Transcript_42067/g.136543  ORF Transcript_42067/g.136543 Transcript_42067/m.136543 type:complete len:290 (-) Transcript_42067:290-1159(-)
MDAALPISASSMSSSSKCSSSHAEAASLEALATASAARLHAFSEGCSPSLSPSLPPSFSLTSASLPPCFLDRLSSTKQLSSAGGLRSRLTFSPRLENISSRSSRLRSADGARQPHSCRRRAIASAPAPRLISARTRSATLLAHASNSAAGTGRPAIASPSAQKRDTSRNRSAFSAACSSSASASSASVRWPRLTGGSPTAFCSFRSKSSRVGDGEGRLRMSGRLPVASSSWKGLLARNSARTPARGGLLVRQRKQSSPSSMPTGRKATPTKTSTTPRETRRWRRLRRSH